MFLFVLAVSGTASFDRQASVSCAENGRTNSYDCGSLENCRTIVARHTHGQRIDRQTIVLERRSQLFETPKRFALSLESLALSGQTHQAT